MHPGVQYVILKIDYIATRKIIYRAICFPIRFYVWPISLLLMTYMFSHFCLTVLLQPDTVTGDIVFIIQQKEHPKFKRKFDDLYVEHTLTLTEALCGFQFVLTHLDGRQLLIKSNPGEVIKPGKNLLPLCAILSVRRDKLQSLNASLKYRLRSSQVSGNEEKAFKP